MHDEENSFYVWDYDRSLSIKYIWQHLFKKLGLENKISYEKKEVKEKITLNDYRKIIKTYSKEQLCYIIFSVLSDLYEVRKPNGEVWRCPVCDNVQFRHKDWPYKRKIFNFKKVAKILGFTKENNLDYE